MSPYAPALPCHNRRCGNLRPCPQHGDRKKDRRRRRGYGRRWAKFRQMQINREPSCRLCGREATEVDHVRPVTSQYDADFYNPENLQSLCGVCHRRKTSADVRAGLTRRSP